MNTLTWKYVKPLKKANAIEAFESANGIKLPADIVSCVQQNNGGRSDKKIFNTQLSSGRVFKTLLSFNEDDIETVHSAVGILKEEGQSLVPLASDPGGNYICYDPVDGIVLWLHETNSVEKITDNFKEFLAKLY
ncbi:MAG: SMI1/KNR4 family protein [Oscillospiraceae bacterium]|jgi:hypothetical protein|nr:SMI1/KNR4 family protein [Oscillospiraceae bacterium]